MSFTPEEVAAGQAIYTRRMLFYYDLRVLWLSNPLIWKCPTSRLLAHYDRYITINHLDVGVGSGYYLDKCRFPAPDPRISLIDLNSNSLAFAAPRIARYQPETYLRNVLEPIPFDGQVFDSVGLNYLLHCLPGDMTAKCCAFDHLKPLMATASVIFGSTLLQGRSEKERGGARADGSLSDGVFSNTRDDLNSLRRELEKRFEDVSIEVVGCAALFAARA
jgi:hypothetical protein